MIQYKNDKKEYILLEVPEYSEYLIEYGDLFGIKDIAGWRDYNKIASNLSKKATIVGIVTNITEQEAQEIVEKDLVLYKNYLGAAKPLWILAYNSLISLCESHKLNPKKTMVIKL